MMNKIKKLFQVKHPKTRHIYAVTAGALLGELIVYIEKDEADYCFLSLPEMNIRKIPKDKFYFGIDNKIVDVVEKMPASVYSVCRLQYVKNIGKIE